VRSTGGGGSGVTDGICVARMKSGLTLGENAPAMKTQTARRTSALRLIDSVLDHL